MYSLKDALVAALRVVGIIGQEERITFEKLELDYVIPYKFIHQIVERDGYKGAPDNTFYANISRSTLQ